MPLDAIVALATPPGFGGVGIVRVSGPNLSSIIDGLLATPLQPRHVHYTAIHDTQGDLIDEGIVVHFPAPNSYTGEDVIEFQCHGGPVILKRVVESVVQLGARLAEPGEFTQRAFLNNKLDLAQAEAVTDFIHANSEYAAKCALRSMQGHFSKLVNELVDKLVRLRMFVESAIDFPDEDIDFIESEQVVNQLKTIGVQLKNIMATAKQGVLLKEGMTVVIAGKPNAGKSSLLNLLSGRESAIVTDIAGTTRDIVREHIHLDGLPIHIIDTAGLRETSDRVEQEGVKRAKKEMRQADVILLIIDSSVETVESLEQLKKEVMDHIGVHIPLLIIYNKQDLCARATEMNDNELAISVKLNQGVEQLTQRLQNQVGFQVKSEGAFMARARHMEALQQAQALIEHGCEQLKRQAAPELLAEDLRQAQYALNRITGEFTSDDLLGEIFSQFCIGK